MNNRTIPLAEFRRLSGLTANAIVWLLEHNKLPLTYSPTHGLEVDAGAATVSELLASLRREHGATLDRHEAVFMERIGAVIHRHLDAVITDATARSGVGATSDDESR